MSKQLKVLNLGCGHKVSAHPDVINIDWSIYLRMRKSRLLSWLSPLLLSGERRTRFDRLPSNIMPYDLSKGIPFPDNSADVIFHSNVLEHLDRDVAECFLAEARRALKPGGIHRIVVPDFEEACAAYMAHIATCENNTEAQARHEDYIARVIEQSVRREAAGTRLQRPLRRFVENALLGDARRRGETHQWMYDRISLAVLLRRLGYINVRLMSYDTSDIAGWSQYGLDTNDDGSEYAPGSLYMEASK
jgi:SAM-dependent methyltransferase